MLIQTELQEKRERKFKKKKENKLNTKKQCKRQDNYKKKIV